MQSKHFLSYSDERRLYGHCIDYNINALKGSEIEGTYSYYAQKMWQSRNKLPLKLFLQQQGQQISVKRWTNLLVSYFLFECYASSLLASS